MAKPQLDKDVQAQLKSWDWDYIIDFGYNTVSHLRGGQMNFLRGTLMEQLISRQDTQLECVREDHKDFEWHRFNLTVELKSQFNQSMYNKGGRLKDSYKVNLCNMRSLKKITKNQICDLVLVLRKDGAFIITRDMAFQNHRQIGKQVDIIVGPNQIIEISGYKSLSSVQQVFDINETVIKFCDTLIDDAKKHYDSRPK
jgi:hypothetical protein